MQEAKIIYLPKIEDPRGNLSIIEEETHILFKIKRTYWIYEVPCGHAIEGYAFREQQEFICALSGSFDVVVDYGSKKQTFSLNRPNYGLYIPAGIWRQKQNFSTNSLALVLNSGHYSADDYIYQYEEFLNLSKQYGK